MKNFYDSMPLADSAPWRDIAFSRRNLDVIRDVLASIVERGLQRRTGPVRWADVGCGLGGTYLVAKELSYDYVGIDSSSKHIEYCEAQHPGGRFICEEWLCHRGEYDLVSFISTLHHFTDWRVALHRAFALCLPGGVVYVDHEPTRCMAWLSRPYSIYCRRVAVDVIGQVEIHWFQKPSIRPCELPDGKTVYHFDFIPLLGRLGVRSHRSIPGRFFPFWRKTMPKDTWRPDRLLDVAP